MLPSRRWALSLDGVLVIDKPGGMTSHDVVDQVRRKLATRKVGHAGTLDPDATGVLVVGVGRATRFLSYAQEAPKRYRARARLGISTSTQDASGEVLEERSVDADADRVAAALKRFIGEIDQVPPMVSAVKIAGERLYKKARRGEEVDRPARRVTIYAADMISYEDSRHLLEFDVRCSAGTFVRTLAHDLGEQLGCGAHLTELRRTEAGGFRLEDAQPLDTISKESLRPLTEAVRVLPSVEIGADDATALRHGRFAPAPGVAGEPRFVAAICDGDLVAVCRLESDRLYPERVVAA